MYFAPLRVAYHAFLNYSFREDLPRNAATQLQTWHDSVRDCGLCIVENFLDRGTCVRMVDEVNRLQIEYPSVVQRASKGTDLRIFGAETKSLLIRNFATDARLLTLATTFLGSGAKNTFTLAGKITAEEENLGSGEGWHRDAFFKQFKAIVYLTDTTENNGAFEYILNSHRLARKYTDCYRYDIPLHTTRVSDRAVAKLAALEPRRHRTVVGAAGSLILADTTGLHRGRPLRSGFRFALTNYYYPARDATSDKYEEFKPVLGYHVAAP